MSSRPRTQLLDAGGARLGEDGLRNWARTLPRRDAHVARSYRYPLALIAWHGEAVGIDIERIEARDRAFADSICTPSERALGLAGSAAELASLWCSKEALAKALGDARRYDPRRLESPMGWPGGASGRWRAAALEAPAGHVAWVCWRVGTVRRS